MNKKIIYTFIISLILIACNKEEEENPGPKIYLIMPEDGFILDKDDELLLTPQITYNHEDAEYTWQLDDGEIISKRQHDTLKNQTYGIKNLTFTVTTPYGSDSQKVPVTVVDLFSFEEEIDTLDKNGIFFPEDESKFSTGSYLELPFENNNKEAEVTNWNGFVLSKNTNKTKTDSTNQFSVYDTGGSGGSKVFVVFKQGGKNKISFNDGSTHTFSSIDVNNTTLAFSIMKKTTLFDLKEKDDFYELDIYGYDANGTRIDNPITTRLADYRFSDNNDKFILDEWKTVKLEDLGKVSALEFQLRSSAENDEENTLPMDVCLDNLIIKD